LRALRLIAAMLFLSIGTLSLIFSARTLAPPSVYSKDFGQEYLLARAIRDGVDPYKPVRELAERYAAPIGFMDKQHPTPHPPTVGILLQPVAVLSYPSAAVVWFVFELMCLVAAVRLLALANDLQLRVMAAPLVAGMIVAWPAVQLDLGLGQLMTPMLALLAAAQLALLKSRSVLGGVLLGFTFLIKPIAWPCLLGLAMLRNWKAVGAATAVCAVGVVVSGFVIGMDRLVNYVVVVLPGISASMASERTNISLWTVGPRLFATLPAAHAAAALPAVVAIAFCVWAARHRPTLRAAMAVGVALSSVLSPLAWQFYMVLAVLPLSYVVGMFVRRRVRASHGLLGLAAFVLLTISYHAWLDIAAAVRLDVVLLGPTLGIVLLALLIGSLSPNRPVQR